MHCKSSLAAHKPHQQTTYTTKHRFIHTYIMRSYQHVRDSISSCRQCQLRSQMPVHAGTPTNSMQHQDYHTKALYTGLLSTLPNTNSHFHTNFTNIAIQKLSPNTILATPPSDIHQPKLTLPREDRVHLSRLRCGHHLAQAKYHKRIDDSVDNACIYCHTTTHNLTHIITLCPALTHIRAQHNITVHQPYGIHWLTVCFSSGEQTCSAIQVEAT